MVEGKVQSLLSVFALQLVLNKMIAVPLVLDFDLQNQVQVITAAPDALNGYRVGFYLLEFTGEITSWVL